MEGTNRNWTVLANLTPQPDGFAAAGLNRYVAEGIE